jgi:nicotinate-nucleotide--dimethylbenzimidazole phosphoribosyltransferase
VGILQDVLAGIKGIDDEVKEKAQKRLDSLVKPIGSLGKLEEMAVQLAAITGNIYPNVEKKAVMIMASDNGVWEEGVSPIPQEVTILQTRNFLKGIAGINVLTKHAGADMKIVDIGINGEIDHPQIMNKKIRKGTCNMAKEPAMTREEAIQAIEVGVEMVKALKEEGYHLLGTGEMGICNTSTSSAVIMCLTGISVDEAVGKGAGVTEKQFIHKKNVIKKAVQINQPDCHDPLDVVAKVGGFDIAGLVGCFLGAAYYKVPIVIDGFISGAAALAAYKMNPLVKEYMITSHHTAEQGFVKAMNELDMEAILHLDMRLGEGSGCAVAFPMIEAAAKVIREMGTFEEGQIDDKDYVDIR